MDILQGNFTWEDRTSLKLGALFERYGFARYYMGKFESYDLYRENKNFLKSDTAITFTDSAGRLMALKPDITMSIAKHAAENGPAEKLYYVENVFRKAPGRPDVAEIKQIGLEYIGGSKEDLYPALETVLLACKSLEMIDPAHILSVGHMGFISAALDAAALYGPRREQALEAIRQKNPGSLAALMSGEENPLLHLLASLSAPLPTALPLLAETAAVRGNAELYTCVEELRALHAALLAVGFAGQVHIDFSIINDMGYYNGIVFAGYIRGIPRAVLSGGRYDNLMQKFGKKRPALGFAVYLGELARAFSTPPVFDADLLLLCGDAEPVARLRAVETLTQDGYSVLSCIEPPLGFKAARTLRLLENGEMEEIAHA